MKEIIVLLLLCMLSFSTSAGIVKVSGSLKEFKMNKVEMHECGIAADICANKILIHVDTNGLFQLKIKLKQPKYYLIGHNLLYLEPGDNLNVKLGYSVSRGEFEGEGDEANIYLKGCERMEIWKLFNTSGFEINRKIPSFETCKEKADSLIKARLQELNRLTKVDDRFREFEKIRIKASLVQIYLDYFSYGQLSKWDDSKEVKLEKKKAFYRTLKPLVEPLLTELVVSDKYLELSEVRKVLEECYLSEEFEFTQSQTFIDWIQTGIRMNQLGNGLKKNEYESYKDFARKIQNKDLKRAFSIKLQKRATLMEGRVAPEILLKDIDGNVSKLSDLKGKPLFVDIWATWCLPCIFQMPHFQELSEKFRGIQFVGISIDLEEQRWKNKLEKEGIPPCIKEYLADPYALSDSWDVTMIPRFILIDKNFKIITAFATRPSEKDEIEAILRELE